MLVCAWAASLALAEGPRRVPVTVSEYEAMKGPDAQTFPPQVVRLYNIRRVLDGDVPAGERGESLRLVEKLGADEPALLEAMGAILSDPKASPELQQLALEHLLKKNRPGLAAQAIKVLPSVAAGSGLRQAVLDWLAKNGDASMLVDIVKAWAQEKPNSPDENRYRQVVEKIASQPWDQALLAAINSESFYARGSAMSVLAARCTAATLAPRLSALTPKTEPMAALKASVTQMNYVPDGGPSLLAVVSIHRTRPDSFRDVARLVRQWQGDGGYEFSIRDFHLLSRLTSDPLRKPLRRRELAAAIGTSLAGRSHMSRAPQSAEADSFAKHAASLSLADLWNLYLLDQMLARPRVLLALRVMADRDRADTRAEWGGLVVYESGQAEARLYPAEKDVPPDDRRYFASRQMAADARDALCRFAGHFEKAANAARAGPTADELRAAREDNYYGLVFTSLSETEFCAHYYNPQGTVISLGRMQYKY